MFFIFATVLSTEHIKKCAAEVGFTLCGVARARELAEHGEWYARALAASGECALPYLARDPGRRLDPARLVAGARTVIVCAVNYRNARSGGYPADFPAPRIASYALSGEYQPKIKGMLTRMASMLGLPSDGGTGRGRTWMAASDTSAILEKAWAVEAGLGWVGRNSLLVTPRHGSFLLLGELVTAEECDLYDEPWRGTGCGSCRRCVESCPACALVPQLSDATQPQFQPQSQPQYQSSSQGAPPSRGVCAVDTGRCVSALTIEKSSLPPDPARLHGWAFGCDECQSVCPYNKVSPLFGNRLFAPRFDPADFSTEKWRAMSDGEFAETFTDTPLWRIGPERMRKNAAAAKKGDEKF